MYIRTRLIKTTSDSIGFPKKIVLTSTSKNGLDINGYTFSEERFYRTPRENYAIYLGLTKKELIDLKTKYKINNSRQSYEFLIDKFNYYEIAESIDDDIPDIYSNCLEPYFYRLFEGRDNILRQLGIYDTITEEEQDLFDEKYCVLLSEKVTPLFDKIIKDFVKTSEYKSHKYKQNIIFKYRKNKKKFIKTFNCSDTDYDICFNVYGRLVNKEYFYKLKEGHIS